MFSLSLSRHHGLFIALGAAALLVYLGISGSFVERLRWWLDSADRNPAGLSIGLHDYRWDGRRTLLPGIRSNLSGLTCDADNSASRRIIEHHGGIAEQPYNPPGGGVQVLRYWIALDKLGT